MRLGHISRLIEADGMPGLAESQAMFSDDDTAGGQFTAELLEKFDINTLDREQRAVSAPALWSFRRPFSLEHFATQLNLTTDHETRYPILTEFVSQENVLRALRYLPAVFEWNKLVMAHSNRRVERDYARGTSVAQVIQDLPEAERQRWSTAFDGFASAWNLSWQAVGRYGCLRIPDMFLQVTMTPDTNFSFTLTTEQDEGICSLALIQFLTERHNHFVQLVDERNLMRGRDRTARQPVVSSRFLTAAHTIRYDLAGDFVPFLEAQCCEISASGGTAYNFKNAEAYIFERYLNSKPVMDLEVRMFEFKNEQHIGDGLGALRSKVAQEPLPRDIQTSIVTDMDGGAAAAASCLELLETCVSFLSVTGGSFVQRLDSAVGEMTLSEYLRTVLLLDEAGLGSRVVAQQVRLKHIEALWNLLQSLTADASDAFSKVHPKYCEPLGDVATEQLTEAASQLDCTTLLPVFKSFVVRQLADDDTHTATITPDSNIKENIGWLEAGDNWLLDLPWFADSFPDGIVMANAVECYRLLESLAPG